MEQPDHGVLLNPTLSSPSSPSLSPCVLAGQAPRRKVSGIQHGDDRFLARVGGELDRALLDVLMSPAGILRRATSPGP